MIIQDTNTHTHTKNADGADRATRNSKTTNRPTQIRVHQANDVKVEQREAYKQSKIVGKQQAKALEAQRETLEDHTLTRAMDRIELMS